jgi:colanic acid biosynthesis glycosyl transferase WcaI
VQHVTLITPTYAPDAVGTPLYVADLVRGFASQGVLTRVVTGKPYYPGFVRVSGYRAGWISELRGAESILRVPTIVPKGGRAAWRVLSDVNFVVQILVAVAVGKLDRSRKVIGISPGTPFSLLAARFCTRKGGRCVAVVHDIQHGLAAATGVPGPIVAIMRFVEVYILNRMSAVAVLTESMSESLKRAGVSSPIFVEPLWPTISMKDATAEEDENLLLYSGNLGAKQGVESLAWVAADLSTRAPHVRLMIRGDGSARDRLVELCRSERIDNVTFGDFVPESGLASSLREAAVHLVTQLPQGGDAAIPSKILNILAVGRPIVAMADPGSGVWDLAQEVSAIRCVPPGDAAAMAAEIVQILSNRRLREDMGQAAAEYAQEHRSRDAAAKSLLSSVGVGPQAYGT